MAKNRPQKKGGAKKQKAVEDADSAAALKNDADDKVWAGLAAELSAMDTRIAALKEKRSELLHKYKDQFGLKIGAFNQAYKDSQREGAEKATHVASYLQYARALGVMADLPLGLAAVVDKSVAKAAKLADKEAAEKAAEAEPAAGDEPGEDPEPEASIH